MILAFEHYVDILLKNMKILILQYVFNDFIRNMHSTEICRIAGFATFTIGF